MKRKIGILWDSIDLFDWCLWGILVFFCFISYQYADILHTGGSSIAYLNGHILDFYDYNQAKMDVNNYMPTTYIFFAIWNIPIRLLGLITDSTMAAGAFVRMWYKLGTFLLFLGTAYLIYKICMEKAVPRKQAVITAFLFLSNPIAIYSELIFGQYDIITTFFMCLGFYYYLKQDRNKFILAFSVALTCKYFALLIFVPLLLIIEKDVRRIIRDVVRVFGLFIVELLVYVTSEAFRTGVFDFFATKYLFSVSLDDGHIQISVGIVLWVLLCAVCFFIACKEEERFSWSIYIICAVMFLCFGLSYWHPQWLLMAIPFLTIGAAFHKRNDIYMMLDLLMMVIYVVYVVNQYPYCDQDLFNGGIFRRFVYGLVGKNVKMADLFMIRDVGLIFSLFVGVLLAYVVFLHPKMLCLPEQVCEKMQKGILRLRYIGGCCFFIVPSLICLAINITCPRIIYAANDQEKLEVIGAMSKEDEYEQVFTAEGDQVTGIAVDLGTYIRENHSVLKCELLEKSTNTILNVLQIDTSRLIDNEYVRFDFEEASKVKKEDQYAIRIKVISMLPDDTFTFYRTLERPDHDGRSYALINGQRKNYDLSIKVYGR